MENEYRFREIDRLEQRVNDLSLILIVILSILAGIIIDELIHL